MADVPQLLTGGPLNSLDVGEVEDGSQWLFVQWKKNSGLLWFATWPCDEEPPFLPEGWPKENHRVLLYMLDGDKWQFDREVTEGLDG